MGNLIWIILIALAGVLAYLFGEKTKEEKKVNSAKVPNSVKQWEPLVFEASKEFEVPFSIAQAVLWQESAGKENARGSAGEIGLMQLKEIAVKDLKLQGFGRFPGWDKNSEQNIRAGVAFLALQKKRTGDWFDAVKAYNQGFEGMKENPELANEYLNEVKAKEKFF